MTEIKVTDMRDKIKTMKFQYLSPHLYNFIDDIPDLMSVQLVGGCLDLLHLQGHSNYIGAFPRLVENFSFT